MFLRSLVICCYLMGAYWASYHFPSMKMVFYPTLGAFSFLFMHRVDNIREIRRIILGAIIAVTMGSIFYSISTGAISFFLTALVTITLIQFFKWNAAPILAVSFIPYFAHPISMWALPIAVLVSLTGLLVSIWLIGKVEQLNWYVNLSGKLTQARQLMRTPFEPLKKEL
ncbi:HPP family protein [Paenibacillus qinlingensis]|uniref:Membrane protein YdbS with pleckstrin-like domain n=1 Tax=Paenibacillus qinlingensis TaxID=1837343 RepID=A0ABU1P4W8_9BACL|nr:HPP family protein [Paenibacillus qinlingensis]MDR6554267.1 membrane protein YdbS with pleckstrin-like domain [Paenibacillus qinlingensis]